MLSREEFKRPTFAQLADKLSRIPKAKNIFTMSRAETVIAPRPAYDSNPIVSIYADPNKSVLPDIGKYDNNYGLGAADHLDIMAPSQTDYGGIVHLNY